MHVLRNIALGIGATAPMLLLSPAYSASCEGDPLNIVKSLYNPYMVGHWNSCPDMDLVRSCYVHDDTVPADLSISAFATKKLVKLIIANRQWEKASDLDFDVIVNGQDWTLSDLNVEALPEPKPTQCAVAAEFSNFGHHMTITYEFVLEEGKWLIDDVHGYEIPCGYWIFSELLKHHGRETKCD